MADTADLRSVVFGRGGSSPSSGIILGEFMSTKSTTISRLMESFSIIFTIGFLFLSILFFVDDTLGTSFAPTNAIQALISGGFWLIMSILFYTRSHYISNKEVNNVNS